MVNMAGVVSFGHLLQRGVTRVDGYGGNMARVVSFGHLSQTQMVRVGGGWGGQVGGWL